MYGNYFLIDGAAGLPDLTLSELNLSKDAADPTLQTMGTCRVRAIEKDGADYRAREHWAMIIFFYKNISFYLAIKIVEDKLVISLK